MKLLPFLVLAAVGVSLAAAPNYDPWTYMYSGGSRIDCGYYGSPCIADWNGDGSKDMILGIFSNGNIWFYANENTNDSPVFSTYSVLQADGSNITLPYG